jgi:hypothetical protein
MDFKELKVTVYARLDAIANAEKITRKEMAALSRELLVYVPNTNDIDVVNRLLGVFTVMNRKSAIMFFSHFLPWEKETDKDGSFVRFGKMFKGEKSYNKKVKLIEAFLADEENNFWNWVDDNIEVKPRDLGASVAPRS